MADISRPIELCIYVVCSPYSSYVVCDRVVGWLRGIKVLEFGCECLVFLGTVLQQCAIGGGLEQH